jgi:arylsulfatase A-like enzyme
MKKLFACIGLLAALHAAADDNFKPNIVLIVIDDMGWADIGYHSEEIRSPNLDQLAATGVELDQHYVMPQCTPTRVALMTGRYPSRFGRHCTTASNVQAFPFGTVTLASALREAGYDTAITGKWHMGSLPKWGPRQFGFTHTHGSFAGAVGMFDHRYRLNLESYTQTWHRNDEFLEQEGHAYDLCTDEAVGWIENTLKPPFFLYVPYLGVHTPLVEPEERIESQTQTKGDRRIMAAAVEHLDEQIGRIIEALDRKKLRENTLVVIFSDNGGFPNYRGGNYPAPDMALKNFSSNEPLRGQKTHIFEGGIRVPALVNWPGRLEARTVTAPMHAVDWMPTLLRLAGIDDVQEPGDGRDIWPLLTGKETRTDPQHVFYWLWGSDRIALRQGDWKLARNGGKGPFLLFNLADDPNEKNDLATEHPDKVNRLMTLLKQQQAVDAKGKAPWM